ncbi:hypothetical protein DKX38_010719 [Salix brachista]|uniref:Uncharacterized protein n=1 Tax=Salix brachista TaxID=2182728 RepID=A0A5N5MEE1_9ROSI|nr:hypothetical protein DKX38_010719 [Salix brachista]
MSSSLEAKIMAIDGFGLLLITIIVSPRHDTHKASTLSSFSQIFIDLILTCIFKDCDAPDQHIICKRREFLVVGNGLNYQVFSCLLTSKSLSYAYFLVKFSCELQRNLSRVSLPLPTRKTQTKNNRDGKQIMIAYMKLAQIQGVTSAPACIYRIQKPSKILHGKEGGCLKKLHASFTRSWRKK